MLAGLHRANLFAKLEYLPGYLLLGGGVPVKVGNEVIGAVGAGGAPSGNQGEQCAMVVC